MTTTTSALNSLRRTSPVNPAPVATPATVATAAPVASTQAAPYGNAPRAPAHASANPMQRLDFNDARPPQESQGGTPFIRVQPEGEPVNKNASLRMRLRLLDVRMGTTREKGQNYARARYEVLETSRADVHPVGSMCTWWCDLDNRDVAPNILLGFACAHTGFPADEITAMEPNPADPNGPPVSRAWSVISALFDADANPLIGTEIWCVASYTRNARTKSTLTSVPGKTLQAFDEARGAGRDPLANVSLPRPRSSDGDNVPF